jgi:hypothetical protein
MHYIITFNFPELTLHNLFFFWKLKSQPNRLSMFCLAHYDGWQYFCSYHIVCTQFHVFTFRVNSNLFSAILSIIEAKSVWNDIKMFFTVKATTCSFIQDVASIVLCVCLSFQRWSKHSLHLIRRITNRM